MATSLKEQTVLVVDDDPTSRMLMVRVLSHLQVEVLEAEDGIEALVMVDEHNPDFVILDLNMPNMDGFEVLEALRKSNEHLALPVVCMSSSSRVSDIVRAKEFGVVDYLLKPIRRHETHQRLRQVFEEHADWRIRQKTLESSGGTNRKVLIVDPDANFREFAVPLLDNYKVIQTASAGEAVKLCGEQHPGIILCAEDLPLLSEAKFASLVKEGAAADGVLSPRVFLTSNAETVSPEKAALFSGVVRKSFVPEVFVENFKNSVGEKESRFVEFQKVVRGGIDADLMSATRQTIGVMTGQDARSAGGSGTDPIAGEIASTIDLSNNAQGFALTVNVVCSRKHTEEFAMKVLRREITVGEGAEEVLGELTNTIAGRLIASLADKGFSLKIGVPETIVADVDTDPMAEWDSTVDFSTSEWQRFLLRIVAREIPVTELDEDEDVAEEPVPIGASGSDQQAAESSDDSDLDDILF